MKPARIFVLVLALGAGGVAAWLAGRQTPPPAAPAPAAPEPAPQIALAEVLVANGDIHVGSRLSEQDMRWEAWPAAAAGSFIRKGERPDAMNKLVGWIARAPFAAGEPIREFKLIDSTGSGYMALMLPSGHRAISVEISPETGAGGFILPHDHVDVILTRRDRAAEKDNGGLETFRSGIILSNVQVLAIDQTVEEKAGSRVVVGRTATLELLPYQAAKLALARQQGTLSLALRSVADSTGTVAVDESDEGTEPKGPLGPTITVFRSLGGASTVYRVVNGERRVESAR
ncbi:MAG TPA: Flp pilus assembly protein CpaB [Xanthobacteraceae bacterium]|jgi:pilus assembly protein CpaB